MYCDRESCPFFNTESCNYLDPSECDLAKIFLQSEEKEAIPFAPLYMKFTYKDEWRHIPMDEVYPVWTLDDFRWAVYVFRERHESQGTITVFATEDLVDWWVWGKIPAGETYKV